MTTYVHPRPISGMALPRYSGFSTFMRLPSLSPEEAGRLDIGLIGLPWDGGTTTRGGSRYGPRQIREMSTLLRSVHPVTKLDPYDVARCADLGDAPTNPVNPGRSLAMLETFVAGIHANGAMPLAFGGDHLVSLPVLRAIKRGRPLALVHFDAHTDMYDVYYEDSRFTHGTPFRRAIEEGLIDPQRTVQIGIRGTIFAPDDYAWCLEQGVRHVTVDFIRERGADAAAALIREAVGGADAYLSFDVDALDPAFAPGTGVPEIAGIHTYEAQRIIRGLRGIDLVGADFVEVSPPIDPSGNTALVAANLGFEALCLMAETVQRRKARTP